MDSKSLMEAIKVFAPTVADRIFGLLGERKLGRDDVNLLLFSLLAEQNANVVKCLDGINGQLVTMQRNFEVMMRELKVLNEGVAVLLRRTE